MNAEAAVMAIEHIDINVMIKGEANANVNAV
jgi:hypothetical protein